MARTFTKNLSNLLTLGTNAVGPLLNGASSILVAAQVRPASYDTATGDNVVFVSFIHGSQTGILLNVSGPLSVVRGAARSQSVDALQEALGTTTPTTGAWHVAGALARFPEDGFNIYLDSGTPQSSGTSEVFAGTTYALGTPSTPDRIGRSSAAQANQQFAGDIEYVALWRDRSSAQANVVMTSLQGGTHPFDISPQPVFLMVLGYETPDVDLIGGTLQSTINGSLPFVEGPTGLPPAPPSGARPPAVPFFPPAFFRRY